ncbi:unnamed protein product [Ceutorhynchus assimilis]|uniref:Uncharacterized protein n=1 Tax=Ceutorhynchus assimilis TaxID=467358 RepID=A0A9N9M9X9_9CUCU|nr:unnamed protein product [Ceutorhynchus assimilis]
MLWILCVLPLVGSYSVGYQCPEFCYCDSDNISCQYADLTELPNNIYTGIISLDLSHNRFSAFPGDMDAFGELKYLNLSNNQISTLKYSDLMGLEKLETLDLKFNLFHDWKDIHSSTFLPTKNLQFLDFSHNPLRSIPRYSNHLYIESLQILRLSNCSMRIIPVNVFNRLANLKELYLSDNPITSINDTFQIESLRLIDLSQCELNYMEENVFSALTNLEMLILSKNIFLKRFLCNSDHLLYLDLSDSLLDRIPSGSLRKVLRLDLSGNYLRSISAGSFTKLQSLQVLNLSTNSLTTIHERGFEGLTEVISIDLSFNKIQTLDERLLNNNSALSHLNLSHNYIKSLDTISSKSLKMLIASFCEIYELNRYSLELMPNLVTLILSRNFITTLPNRLIARSLSILDVSFCRIRTLNNETFEEMFYLRQINLASNALTSIDPSYFPRAFNVIIKDNPWRCDCQRLKRMYEWISTYSSNRLNGLICDSPEKSAGKTWEEACIAEWYPNRVKKDTMWYYSLGIVIAMVVALFALVIIRRFKSMQDERLRLEDEARRAEEREALSRMHERQREIEYEEDRTAPDPRELQRPPSYNEAILMPMVSASHPSLAGSVHSFGSRASLGGSAADINKKNRIRRKRRRRKSEEMRRASRITLDSDSSSEERYQSMDNLEPRRKPQGPPLESNF